MYGSRKGLVMLFGCLSIHFWFNIWLGSIFILKKEATTPIFHFKKKAKVKQKKNVKKFLFYINIDSKCLNIGI